MSITERNHIFPFLFNNAINTAQRIRMMPIQMNTVFILQFIGLKIAKYIKQYKFQEK